MEQEQVTSAPPAGWYHNSVGLLQWWDGRAWGPIAPGYAQNVQRKSVGVAYVLLLLVGGTGAHRFYLGQGYGAAFLISWLAVVFGYMIEAGRPFWDTGGPNALLLLGGIFYVAIFVVDLFVLPNAVRDANA